jgi:ParB-like chromosome segregation protein Spo0J
MSAVIEATEAKSDQIKWVTPQSLKRHPINEKIYGIEAVDENLKESIKAGGIIEEIQVTPEYVIISGHRRTAAAIELELESVPVRLRYDLDSPEKIEWALIEANRTQRDKTLEQKIREIMMVTEKLKRFRMEVNARYETNDLGEIAKLEGIDAEQVNTSNADQMQEFVRDNFDPAKNKNNSSLKVALNHYGISELHYKKARKAMLAIEEFEKSDKMAEAKQIRHALNSYGFKRFDEVVNRLRGVKVVPKSKRPSALIKKSIEDFEQAIECLPDGNDHTARANMALGMMRSVRDEIIRLYVSKELEPETEKAVTDAN